MRAEFRYTDKPYNLFLIIICKRTEGRTLRHFQLLTWPNSATVLPTKEDLFKLIDLTGQWQDQLKSKRAGNTIVHCL